ncbi:hypothetical protein A374_07469 [Fictibacillus macauensis ZFHKF-1]|uniref:Uncharacterized protein n=1 Tax=Fictibacillus macauensis ZFHKF-1 TaxID=1196324 RepID=I8AIS9_9BACL|nr:hypothetical protein [Fictibacillus macauensis]EIT85657.1 hypothetical protein A374_07469 [Fictibacillus macauensis ZFHKF-1]
MKSLPFFYTLYLINGLLLAGGLVSPAYLMAARWSMIFFNVTALAALIYYKERNNREGWKQLKTRGRSIWWLFFLFNMAAAINEVLHSNLFS